MPPAVPVFGVDSKGGSMAVQERTPSTSTDPSLSARALNVALGVWLFISAFAWPHTMAQHTNTWICGVLAVVFALAATRYPQARVLNTILSVWLFISVWLLPRGNVGTAWNNALVAIVMFCLSLIPSQAMTRLPGAMSGHRMSHGT
jgi:hypothetical protein